jgi:hypothetical protein
MIASAIVIVFFCRCPTNVAFGLTPIVLGSVQMGTFEWQGSNSLFNFFNESGEIIPMLGISNTSAAIISIAVIVGVITHIA